MSLFRSYARDQFNGLLWGKGVHCDEFLLPSSEAYVGANASQLFIPMREKEEDGTAKTTRHEKKFSDSFVFLLLIRFLFDR